MAIEATFWAWCNSRIPWVCHNHILQGSISIYEKTASPYPYMRKLFLNLKSDESLMLAYQQGDSVAFEMLYQRHKSNLFHYLFHSCQNPNIVEDLAHDVWLSVIRRAAQYQASATFKTYLYRIAWHRLVDYWRKSSRNQRFDDEFDEMTYLNPKATLPEGEQSVVMNEIMDAISKLPDEQRVAFLLKEEGFSQQEIADITEAKPETVKSRLRYANNALRIALEDPS